MDIPPGIIGAVVFGVGWTVYRYFRPGDPDRKPGRVARSFETGLWWYFRLLFLPFTLLGMGWRRLRGQDKPGGRVLAHVLDWPEIYHDGLRYTVLADYNPPPRPGRAWLNALGGAALVAVLRLLAYPDWRDPSVGAGVILWPAFFSAIIVYVLSQFPRRRLRLSIGPDGISWRNGGGRRCTVPPSDMPGAVAEVLDRHSKAADEQDTDAMRRKPSYPVYRIASEIVLHSGHALHQTQQVAEIRKDRNGLKAKKLQAGVNLALAEYAGAEDRKLAEAEALRPLD